MFRFSQKQAPLPIARMVLTSIQQVTQSVALPEPTPVEPPPSAKMELIVTAKVAAGLVRITAGYKVGSDYEYLQTT